jgi:hypothetical protein
MTTEIVRLQGNTVPIGTANTNIRAKLIRVLATAPLTITIFDTVTNSQSSSITMAGNTVINIQKKTTDLLTSSDGASCFGTPIGFSY